MIFFIISAKMLSIEEQLSRVSVVSTLLFSTLCGQSGFLLYYGAIKTVTILKLLFKRIGNRNINETDHGFLLPVFMNLLNFPAVPYF